MPDPMIFVDDEKVVLEMPAIPEMDVRQFAKRVADAIDDLDRELQRSKYELGALAESFSDVDGLQELSSDARDCLEEAKRRALRAQEAFGRQHLRRASAELRECEDALSQLYKCRATELTT